MKTLPHPTFPILVDPLLSREVRIQPETFDARVGQARATRRRIEQKSAKILPTALAIEEREETQFGAIEVPKSDLILFTGRLFEDLEPFFLCEASFRVLPRRELFAAHDAVRPFGLSVDKHLETLSKPLKKTLL